MWDLPIASFLIILLFFIVAFAYSSVGLGGGSTYTALMTIVGASYVVIPTISLMLNLFVTSVGSFNFIRKKHTRIGLILPFLVSSIPMAYVGGTLAVSKDVFYWILLISLILTASRIYVWESTSLGLDICKYQKIFLSLISGALLGLVAGIVGIGGGIYLVPLIIILGLGTGKEAAACGAIFVWLNSLSGLIARVQNLSIDIVDYLPLILVVLLGGGIGSYLGSGNLKPKTLEKILGGVIVVAIFFLGKKMLFS